MAWEDAGYARRCFHIRAWQSAAVAFDECNWLANRFLGGIFCGSQGMTIEIPVVVDSLLKVEGGLDLT